MAHPPPERDGRPAAPARQERLESGMIPLVTVVTMLGLVVMIALVGNLGAVVGEKVEVQGAADAAAYSDALWMARGMNSITATNHLMGEATALVVLIDALGGPEIGRAERSNQSATMNESISLMASGPSPIISLFDVAAGGSLRQADETLLETVAKLFIDDGGKHAVWATVYDAQLTLKSGLLTALNVKALSNAASKAIAVIPPMAPFAEALNLGVHIGVDVLIGKLAQEWVVLKGVEFGAEILGSAQVGPSRLLRELVIPALSRFGDATAGGSRRDGTGGTSTAINRSVERAHKLLRGRHRVAEIAGFPAPADLRLPVVAEPPPDPKASGGAVEPPPSLWAGRAPSGPVAELAKLERRVLDAFREVSRWVDRINSIGLGLLPDKFKLPSLDSLLKSAAPLPPGPLGEKFGGRGYASNRSLKELEDKYACDWRAESRGQWVRATFPQVDSLRAPIRRFFRETMASSGAADYYVHWTDRYTIAEANSLRKNPETSAPGESRDSAEMLGWLGRELARTRRAFDKAMDPKDEEFSLDERSDPLAPISRRIDDLAAGLQSRLNRLSLPAPARDLARRWLGEAAGHVEAARREALAVPFDEDKIDMDEADFRALMGGVILAEKIDGLLSMLGDLMDDLDHFLDLLKSGPPRMYVMRGMVPDAKGTEPWTWDEAQADRLFTVLTLARRDPAPAPFAPALFGGPKRGAVAIAQAIFYNANGRDPSPPAAGRQPNTGWDTLNWAPPVAAPEWGAAPGGDGPSLGPFGFPAKVFTGPIRPSASARIQLNWRAKLTPITVDRLDAIANAKGLSAPLREAVRTVRDHAPELLSH